MAHRWTPLGLLLGLPLSAACQTGGGPGSGTDDIEDTDTTLSLQGGVDAPVDECALPCLTLGARPGAKLALRNPGGTVVAQATADTAGQAQLCPTQGSLTPVAEGMVTVVVEQVDAGERLEIPLDVRPFGWAMGRERVAGAPATLRYPDPWQPPAAPFFTQPALGEGWCDEHITSPHLTAGGLLLFSGKGQTTRGAYRLGALWMDDLRLEAAPILPPASLAAWDSGGQVSPSAIFVEGEGYTLWYHGTAASDAPAEEGGIGAVGRATSADGIVWAADTHNPVFGTGQAEPKRTHPAVLDYGDDSGIIEMWYLSDGGALQFALSADGGASFTPHCGGALPMQGKSPEVFWDGDRYLMTWGTGQPYAAEIRYGESLDGIRWAFASQPALTTDDDDEGWHPRDISNGQLVMVDGALVMLYLGVWDIDEEGRTTSSGFGLAVPGGSGR